MGWLDEDKRCPYCNNVTNAAKGFNKQNLKRLVFGKPNIQDWVMLFIIIMVLLLAWRYKIETQTCNDVLNNLESICIKYHEGIVKMQENDEVNYANPSFNLTGILLEVKNETQKG